MTAEPLPSHDRDHEVLSFHLGDQNYAIDIMSVREIRGWSKPTSLPHAPAYLCGVINLRGTVLPVIDLALRLGAPESRPTPRDVIIVVSVDGLDAGLLVSAVSNILTLTGDALQALPGAAIENVPTFISALTVQDGSMIRLLDLSALLGSHNGQAA